MDGYRGTAVVMAALRLAPMFFVRPGELRQAKWPQFDLDAATWKYVSSKTKQPHIVSLSTQVVAVLRDLHQVTGRGEYAFPGARSSKRPMSENAVLAALRTLGVGKDELVPHAFRAIARTFLDETLNFSGRFFAIKFNLGERLCGGDANAGRDTDPAVDALT